MPYITLENGTRVKISQESYDALRESVKKKKRWRGQRGEVFYFIDKDGDILSMEDKKPRTLYKTICAEWSSLLMGKMYAFGNYFRTREQAEKTRDKIQALTNVWDWWRENSGFEPDWKDDKQEKYQIVYRYDYEGFYPELGVVENVSPFMPTFRLEEAKSCIKACKKDLEVIWGVNNE